MIICGITHAKGVSKKSGEPYDAYVLHCLSRRINCIDGFVAEQLWITPLEYDKYKPQVGQQIRPFKEGGYYDLQCPLDLRVLADVV